MKISYPKSIDDLIAIINESIPSLYVCSKTSTVLPFDKLENHLKLEKQIVDLSLMPKAMFLEGENVRVSGAVTWEELRVFLRSKGRDLKIAPTDKSASVLAGLATSCTGELSFGFGTLRNQTKFIKYINHEGKEKELDEKPFLDLPMEYKSEQEKYEGFKNAPFPIFKKELDLVIGSEGQLGVITEALIETCPLREDVFFFVPVGNWEKDYSMHLELLNLVQSLRGKILSCELIDSNCLKFTEGHDLKLEDYIVLQFDEIHMEEVYELVIQKLSSNVEENIFQMNEEKFHKLRVSIPRNINEFNSRNSLIKKGTDVQTNIENFGKLLDIYREFSRNHQYTLFGHFGDCHLHFNFLCEAEKISEVDAMLLKFYENDLHQFRCSPFAEHGLGTIKLGYIHKYLNEDIFSYFQQLKEKNDPRNQFFPSGFMSLR